MKNKEADTELESRLLEILVHPCRIEDIPRELPNGHAVSAGQEREQGYLYPHNFPNHWVPQQYLPDLLKGTVYYHYGDNKVEQAAKHYWDAIKGGSDGNSGR